MPPPYPGDLPDPADEQPPTLPVSSDETVRERSRQVPAVPPPAPPPAANPASSSCAETPPSPSADAAGPPEVETVDWPSSMLGEAPTLPPPPVAAGSPPPPTSPVSEQAASPPPAAASDTPEAAPAPPSPPAGITLVPSEPVAPEPPAAADDPALAATLPPPGTTAMGPPPTDGEATWQATDTQARAYQEAILAQGRSGASGGTLFGDYELLSPIAKGGMGVVYKARQRKLNRIVAVKMILSGHLADQSDIERFYAEAEAAAALSHPNIVAIHEIGEVNGQHFFSMDYIEGQSLAALVQENPLPPRRAAELVQTIAEAVQFAHDNGVIHRDLKPANVLLDRRQRPLITDFGLAKQVRSQSQRTMAGSIMGTPSYMPPEQAAGKTEQIGPWSDLYALGAILYELLTGRPPFRAASPFETIRQVLDTEPPSPRLLNPGVPKDLETICLKCLQKERTRRYASAQELADELGRFLRGEPIRARPISQAERLWRLCRRHPVTASAIALAVLLLIGTLGVVTVSNIYISAANVRIAAALAESESSLRDAVQVVDDLLTRVSEDVLLNQPGMQPLRKELLEKALGYYQRFLQRRGDDPRVQDELANAYYRVGRITEVLVSPQEAIPSYEAARDRQEHLVRQPQADAALLRRRREALGTTLTALGAARIKAADLEGARRDLERAVAIRRELYRAHPWIAQSLFKAFTAAQRKTYEGFAQTAAASNGSSAFSSTQRKLKGSAGRQKYSRIRSFS